MKPVSAVGWAAKRKRRRRMAELVSGGADPERVAKDFGVNISTVLLAVRDLAAGELEYADEPELLKRTAAVLREQIDMDRAALTGRERTLEAIEKLQERVKRKAKS